MGLKNGDLAESEPSFSLLGSWHANLLHINRRKCVLFVNDKTLFNFIAPDVSRTEIKELNVLFVGYLSCVLSSEGVPEAAKNKIMEEYRKIEYSGTNSKSVLGSMNDLAFHYKYYLSNCGVHSADVPGIIHKLNHLPMGALGYKHAIEALKTIYKNAT